MRNSARAIIINNGKLLVMFRRRIDGDNKREYYVIPGGGIEPNETPEQTVIRELKEEMCVDIKVKNFVGTGETKDGVAYYYDCEILNNQKVSLGGEELEKQSQTNYYEPMFIDVNNIQDLDLIGKEFVYQALKNNETIK